MENEIDLRELLQVLWRGKYFILAVTAAFILAAIFYIYFMTTPVYQYSALLNLEHYEVKGKEMLTLIEQNAVVAEAVKGLVEDPDELAKSVEINIIPGDEEATLQIKNEYSDPEICTASVEQVGLAIIETASDYRFKQMSLEKERTEKILVYLNEAAAEYLLSRDDQITELLEEDPVYKRILEEKAECLVKLELLNFNLEELAGKPVLDADLWLNGQDETARLVTINKKLYLAAAVLFGLILSIFILFIRHYFLVGAPAIHDGGKEVKKQNKDAREGK
ncbi:MAG: Wzz/FepE/Etk N-terminal domain-containing protein [Dethiobacteria bacterium]